MKSDFMKGIYMIAFSLMISGNAFGWSPDNHSAGGSNSKTLDKDKSKKKELTKQLDLNKPVKFRENKGQVKDINGNAVSSVLFKIELPQINFYITEQGLTMQPYKVEEDGEEEMNERLKEKKHKRKIDEHRKIKIEWERIDVILKNATIKKENIIAEGMEETNFNFFNEHSQDGIYGVKDYKKVTIKDVYPGIDWVFYNSTDKGFKYDFIVNPGADFKLIELIYNSKRPIELNQSGDIKLKTNQGIITEQAPVSFLNGTEIATTFIKNSQNKVSINNDSGYETSISFNLNSDELINRNSPLIIDPQLVWGTYIGGGGLNGPTSITSDATGNIFVTGYTTASDFPVQDAGTYYDGVYSNTDCGFISKFGPTGSLLWSTFYLGVDPTSINIDNSNNIYITGRARAGMPVQNAGTFYQATSGGGSSGGYDDAFILKFDNAGNRLWATYYGGGGFDIGHSIFCDQTGNVFVTGTTTSINLPLQNSGTFFQGVNNGGPTSGGGAASDVFILKFDNTGNRLWATYYGGYGSDQGNAIAIGAAGELYIVGTTNASDFPVQNSGAFFQGTIGGVGDDAFILKFDNVGNRLWSTYYGGASTDEGGSIITDGLGNLFVNGSTNSTNFPVQNAGTYYQGTIQSGSPDAFILKFDNTENRLWATYFGGLGGESSGQGLYGNDSWDNLAINSCGEVFMSMKTSSDIMPVMQACEGGFYDTSLAPNVWNFGEQDIFLTKFSNTGNLLWGSFAGGDGNEIREALTVDINGNLYLTGEWQSVYLNTCPLANPGGGAYYDGTPGGGDDAYILKFAPTPMLVSSASTSVTGCSCSGSATVTPTPASCTYSYLWSNGLTTATASNLCPGTYTVNITANTGCGTATEIITINGSSTPPVVTAAPVSQVLCFGDSTGSASINISGGAPGYTVSWSNGDSTANINGLPAGTYTATVTDSNGCIDTATVAISQPNQLLITTQNIISSACSNSNGGASVLASGGTGSISYQWNDASLTTGPDLTNVPAGSYVVTATDSNSCSVQNTIVIGNINGPQINTSAISNVTCYGGNNGSLSINISGGTPQYDINWSTGSTLTVLSNLQAGTYSVSVTDSTNCVSIASYTVSEPAAISINVSTTPTGCNISSGSATATALGGTGTLTYTWSNSQSGSTINGLASGVYYVTVTDSNSCSSIDSVNIVIANSPVLSIDSVSNVTCNGLNNGIAYVSSTGGTPSYTYTWSNSQTGNTASGLAAGNYTVIVVDNVGCSDSTVLSVTQPTPLTNTFTNIQSDNCNQNTGSVSSNPGGGTPGYQFQWSNGPLTQIISGLAGGVYTLNITDNNGCTKQDSILIPTVAGPTATISKQDVVCFGSADGKASATATGGTPFYIYSWSTGATSASITGLAAGIYTLTVTDALFCAFTISVNIIEPNKLPDFSDLQATNVFTPNNDKVNDRFIPFSMLSTNSSNSSINIETLLSVVEQYEFSVYDRWGILMFQTNNLTEMWDGTVNGKEVPDGTYFWIVKYKVQCGSDNGEQITKGFVHLFR